MENNAGSKEISIGGALMFSEEEVRELSGFVICEDHVEITCGCTSHQYGDAVATLRVFPNGDLQINCDCTPGCPEGPALFFTCACLRFLCVTPSHLILPNVCPLCVMSFTICLEMGAFDECA